MNIEKLIKSKIIEKKRDMRLDYFLNSALYGDKGYYFNQNPIGKKNDFVTAPEVSQMFGEIVGLYLYYIWKENINSKFNLIELGPGNGTLFKDISRSVSSYPDFLKNAKIKFIEINKKLIKIQKESLKKLSLNNTNWSKQINYKTTRPSIIYSNEFFDCFPVRHFILKKHWYERYVSFNQIEKKLFFKNMHVKNNKLISFLNLYKKEKLLEISIQRNKYYEKICKFIKNSGGLFLTIDYGYFENIDNFTLQAIQNHKFSNVLENIGKKDISSHVNFREFINIAKKYKLKIEEYCSQREFLIKYGILERKKTLSKSNINKKFNIELERLIGKDEMGDLFKCLIVSNL